MSHIKHIDCDILILGGGLGGTAAALRAAAQGYTVCMTEENPWIGGHPRPSPAQSEDQLFLTYLHFIREIQVLNTSIGMLISKFLSFPSN